MTQRAVKVEFFELLHAQLTGQLGEHGLTTKVVFSREEHVVIPEEYNGIYAAQLGHEAQSQNSHGLCDTVRQWTYLVDIFGVDGETVDIMYEELFDLLKADMTQNFTVVRCERHKLVTNHQTAAARAVVSLQYVA